MDTDIPGVADKMWMPAAHDPDPVIRRTVQAVEKYDESLRLARNEVTGNWIVVIGERGHPVLDVTDVFGNPDGIRQKLDRFDSKRQGDRILYELDRSVELAKANAQYKSDQLNGEVAEHYASARRRIRGETGSMRGRTPYIGGVKIHA